MSAGTGVLHSEFNPADETVHLLQIWIEPNVLHAAPRYEERALSAATSGVLQLIVSPDGQEGSIAIRQDAKIYRGMFNAGQKVTFSSANNRKQWIQVISGEVTVGVEMLRAGDACGIEGETGFGLLAKTDAHFLLFDLP
jgi:redox-sensitive bicupin YhaK (pirin superfamily)